MKNVKHTLKILYRGLANLLIAPVALLFFLLNHVADRNSLTTSFSQLMSLLPGKTGSFLRVGFYRLTLKYCSADCFIGFGTLLSQYDTEIHEHVYIGPQCNIGSSVIGAHCLLGSGVHILSGKRQHSFTNLDRPIQEQGGHFQKILIGEDCWIGNGAIIMANIGHQCVIGAGSVVTDPVEDFSVVAGNPAIFVKKRT